MTIVAENAQLPLPGALAPVGAAARLQALLATEKKLLAKVGGAQTRLQKLINNIGDFQARLQQASAPLLAKCQAADAEIHEVFGRLLDPANRRLGKRAKKQVQTLYLELQMDGPLSDRRSAAERYEGDVPPMGDFEDFDFGPFESDNDQKTEQPVHKGREREVSRAVFRKLADMLHPDKAPKELNDEERSRREAAMKEASAAYGDGDLARLMWIEKVWLGNNGPVPSGPGALEARCEVVRKRIDELELQAEDLKYELHDLRHSMVGRALADANRVGIDTALGDMCGELEENQAQLESIAKFVIDFRDGRISLQTFLDGPAPFDDDEPDLPLDELIYDFIAFIDSQAPTKKPRGKAGSKRK